MTRASLYALVTALGAGTGSVIAAAVPTLTPMSFVSLGDPATAAPAESGTIRGDLTYAGKVTCGIDTYNLQRVEAGALFEVCVPFINLDTLRGGIDEVEFRMGGVSVKSYLRTTSLRTGTHGACCLIQAPTATSDQFQDLYAYVRPKRGFERRLGPYRIKFGGTAARSAIYVDRAFTGTSTGTISAPWTTINRGVLAAGSAGYDLVLVNETSGKYLEDYNYGASTVTAGSFAHAIEVKPQFGGRISVGRSYRCAMDDVKTGAGSQLLLVYPANQVVQYNTDFDMTNIPAFANAIRPRYANPIMLMHVNCTHVDPAADTDNYYFVPSFEDSDGLIAYPTVLPGGSATFGLINCSGRVRALAGVMLAINCQYTNAGWDYMFVGQGTYGMLHDRVTYSQTRDAYQCYHLLPGAPIAQVINDPDNDRTTLVLAGQTLPAGVITRVSVTSNVATVSCYKADGVTPFGHLLYAGLSLTVKSGPAGGVVGTYTYITKVLDGYRFQFGTVGVADSASAACTFEYYSEQPKVTTGGYGCDLWPLSCATNPGLVPTFNSLALVSGHNPTNNGFGAGLDSAEFISGGGVRNQSFYWLALSNGAGGLSITKTSGPATAPCTVTGTLLKGAGTVNTGSGTLSSVTSGGRTKVTCSTTLPAALVWGTTITVGGVSYRVAKTITGNSFYIPALTGGDFTGQAWTYAWNNHCLFPKSVVQIAGNAPRTVVSVSGTTATLDAPLDVTGDIATPILVNHQPGSGQAVTFIDRQTDDYGNPMTAASNGLAAGDVVTIMGKIHPDNFQTTTNGVIGGAPAENILIQQGKITGQSLQTLFLQAYSTTGQGTLNTSSAGDGRTITFTMPSLTVASADSTSTAYAEVNNAANLRQTTDASGSNLLQYRVIWTAATGFAWSQNGGNIRVKFLSGAYAGAGKSFKLAQQLGTSSYLVDDQGLVAATGGVLTLNAGDTAQAPIPMQDGQLIRIGTGPSDSYTVPAQAGYLQARVVTLDPTNPGTARVNRPFLSIFANASNLVYAVVSSIKDTVWLACIIDGGGSLATFEITAGMQNSGYVQTLLNEGPLFNGDFYAQWPGICGLGFIDSLLGGKFYGHNGPFLDSADLNFSNAQVGGVPDSRYVAATPDTITELNAASFGVTLLTPTSDANYRPTNVTRTTVPQFPWTNDDHPLPVDGTALIGPMAA